MNQFHVIESDTLSWPLTFVSPTTRFRLFVAADVTAGSTEVISKFVLAALKGGMVYFCSWGPDCERLHDMVNEEIVADEIGGRLFASKNGHDTIVTTWHEIHTLEEALDFFVRLAKPDGEFAKDGECWVAVCVNNPEWATSIRRVFELI